MIGLVILSGAGIFSAEEDWSIFGDIQIAAQEPFSPPSFPFSSSYHTDPSESFVAKHHNVSMDVMIFSRDRACQLDLLLRSFELKAPMLAHSVRVIHIIYTASSELLLEGYRKLRRQHVSNKIHWLIEEPSRPFGAIVVDVFAAMSAALVMFLVDDIIFVGDTNLNVLSFQRLQTLPSSLAAVSLRLHPSITYSYAKYATYAAPQLSSKNEWIWADAKHDWAYPMSLDGHVFRASELRFVIDASDFTSPNSLEIALASKPLAAPAMACMPHAVVVNIPSNRVQREVPNRHNKVSGLSADELNIRYMQGMQLCVECIVSQLNLSAVHVEAPLVFEGVTWQPHDLSVKDKIISIIEPSGYQVFAADSVVRVNISVHISAVTAQRTASHYGSKPSWADDQQVRVLLNSEQVAQFALLESDWLQADVDSHSADALRLLRSRSLMIRGLGAGAQRLEVQLGSDISHAALAMQVATTEFFVAHADFGSSNAAEWRRGKRKPCTSTDQVVWTGHNGSVEFVLIVPTHNVASTLERTIASIRAQCYSKFSVWISDDASVDGSFGLAQTLASKDPRFHFRRSERRLGALRNYIETIDAAQSSGESVIVQLDGDDWLASPDALAAVARVYEAARESEQECWLTYGSHVYFPYGRVATAMRYPKQVVQANSFRQYEWLASHLRTFKKHLWRSIHKAALLDPDGQLLDTTGDMAVMFPMLEMAAHRFAHIEDVLVVYNMANPLNDFRVDEERQFAMEHHLRSMPPHRPLKK